MPPSCPLREIALRMLADLRHDTARPESDLPPHHDYSMEINPKTRRIQINVFGCADAEIYTGPDHIDSLVPDLPEILAAFANNYDGQEDPDDPFATFQVLVQVYNEADQHDYAAERNTVITCLPALRPPDPGDRTPHTSTTAEVCPHRGTGPSGPRAARHEGGPAPGRPG